MKRNVFWAMNRKHKVVAILHGPTFEHWEMVQCASCVGILLADGISADGIGRSKSKADFLKRAANSGFTVLP